MAKSLPVSVYAESTPNPKTMKFVANIMLVPDENNYEFGPEDDTSGFPLADKLFTFPFVEHVFFSSNFVAINKSESIDWQDVYSELREYIQNYLTAGYPSFTEEAEKKSAPSSSSKPAKVPENEQEENIVRILNDYVKPAVESDGGAIEFNEFADGKLTLQLKGACSGCPSSNATLKNGIENIFRQMMPEVTEVVALNEET